MNTAEKNLELCQKTLTLIQNPHPVLIIACTLALVGIMYLMYLIFVKPTPSGYWMDQGGTYKIEADWRGNLSVSNSNTPGSYSGSKLRVDDNHGIWSDDTIVWVGEKPITWKRIRT